MAQNPADLSGALIVTGARRDHRPGCAMPGGLVESPGGRWCPFCPDQIVDTELAARVAGLPVLDNLYPLDAGGDSHRVLVLSEEHNWRWHNADHVSARAAAAAWETAVDLVDTPAGGFVSSWSSVGLLAGASKPHAHAQMLAMGAIPPGVRMESDTIGLMSVRRMASDSGWIAGVPQLAQAAGEILLVRRSPANSSGEWGPLAAAAARMLQDDGGCAYTLIAHLTSARPHVHITPRRTVPGAAEVLEGWHAWTEPDLTVLSDRLGAALSVVHGQ